MKSNKRIAGLMAGVLVVGGLVGIALSSGAAQAESASLHLYGQVNNNGLSGNQDLSAGRNVALTVSPASAGIGSSVEVQVTSSNLNLCAGPASGPGANAEELDAVIKINGVEYVLRGPQNDVSILASAYAAAPACNHTIFNPGWVVSSTPGNSSANTNGATNSAGSVTSAGTAISGAGNLGIGSTVFTRSTGAVASYAQLAAPAAAGNYTIDLEALNVNSIAGTSSSSLYDEFDEVVNLDSTGACFNSVLCSGSAGPGGATNAGATAGTGSFYNNNTSVYISAGFTNQVVLTAVGPQVTVTAQNLGATDSWTSATVPTPLTLGSGGKPYIRVNDVLNITGNDQWGANKTYTGSQVTTFLNNNTGIALALCPNSATEPFNTSQGCSPSVLTWGKPTSTGKVSFPTGGITVSGGVLQPFSVEGTLWTQVGDYAIWIRACDLQTTASGGGINGGNDTKSCLYNPGTGAGYTAGYGPTQQVKIPIKLLDNRSISTSSTIVSTGSNFPATGVNWYPGETVAVKGGVGGALVTSSTLATTNSKVACSNGTGTATITTNNALPQTLAVGNYVAVSALSNSANPGAFGGVGSPNSTNAKIATLARNNTVTLAKTASASTVAGTWSNGLVVNGQAVNLTGEAYNISAATLQSDIGTASTNAGVSGVTYTVTGSSTAGFSILVTGYSSLALAGSATSGTTETGQNATLSAYSQTGSTTGFAKFTRSTVNTFTYVNGAFVCGANGTDFDAADTTGVIKQAPGTVSATDAAYSLTASSTGTVGAQVQISDVTDTELYATGIQTDLGASNPAPVQNYAEGGAFSVSRDNCVATAGACTTQQTVNLTVAPGALTQAAVLDASANSNGSTNSSNTVVNFGSITSAVTTGSLSAKLNPITVADARGGTAGWSLTATSTNFTDASSHTINKSNLVTSPTCAADSGAPLSAGGTTAGSAAQSFSSTVNLCTKDTAVNSTTQSSGGKYNITAPLTLSIPAFQIAGTYSATVTVTLV